MLIACGFAAWYVSRERAVYYHDYMFYWQRSADLADVLRTDPLAAWDAVRLSVRRDDYGLLPAVGPAAVMAAVGTGRTAYALAVVILYLTPLAAAGRLIVRRFAPDSGRLAAVIPAVVLLGLPPAWVPLLRGYLDVGGAALVALAAAAYWSRSAGALRWPQLLTTAALLAAAALFRRWYAYAVVAFLVVAAVEAAVTRRVRPVLVLGAAVGVLVGSFAAPWAVRVLTTDLGGELAAWRSAGSLGDRGLEALDVLGPGYAAAAAACGLALLASRSTRRPAAYLLAGVPLAAVPFLRVQDLYPHHQYLFLPAVFLLPSLALARLPRSVRGPAVLVAAGLGTTATTATFAPEAAGLRERLRPAVSRLDWTPLQRDDLPELRLLLRAIDREGGRVAVLASSVRLNPSTLAFAGRSLGEELPGPNRFATVPEVDRTAAFPAGLFAADLVAVADPPQTHLSPGEQCVVTVPAEMLLAGVGVGAAFDRLPEPFAFPGGVRVWLFRRARPVTAAALADFCDRLRAAHPGRPVLFTPPADYDQR